MSQAPELFKPEPRTAHECAGCYFFAHPANVQSCLSEPGNNLCNEIEAFHQLNCIDDSVKWVLTDNEKQS